MGPYGGEESPHLQRERTPTSRIPSTYQPVTDREPSNGYIQPHVPDTPASNEPVLVAHTHNRCQGVCTSKHYLCTVQDPHQLLVGLLEPLPIPHRLCLHIAVDFITSLPISQGYTTILVAVNRFSTACKLMHTPPEKPMVTPPLPIETKDFLCTPS